MPEGDTIYKAARTLQRALAGQVVTRFYSVLAHLASVDDQEPIAGRTIEKVEAAGKHLLMTFSSRLVLRTHMRMSGSWHIYRPAERWQQPRSAMRIVIETTDWVAVAFRVHDAEFVAADRLLQDTPVGGLGPDLLSPGFDADEALRRFKSRSDDTMADALLDQRVMAGVGNVYKSEVLFLAGVHPFAAVAASDESKLRDMIGIAQRLLLDNVVERPGPGMVTYKSARRTTGRMRSEDRLWVYSRSGKPCRKCGTPIAFDKHGDAARVTYWCPACQPMR